MFLVRIRADHKIPDAVSTLPILNSLNDQATGFYSFFLTNHPHELLKNLHSFREAKIFPDAIPIGQDVEHWDYGTNTAYQGTVFAYQSNGDHVVKFKGDTNPFYLSLLPHELVPLVYISFTKYLNIPLAQICYFKHTIIQIKKQSLQDELQILTEIHPDTSFTITKNEQTINLKPKVSLYKKGMNFFYAAISFLKDVLKFICH